MMKDKVAEASVYSNSHMKLNWEKKSKGKKKDQMKMDEEMDLMWKAKSKLNVIFTHFSPQEENVIAGLCVTLHLNHKLQMRFYLKKNKFCPKIKCIMMQEFLEKFPHAK